MILTTERLVLRDFVEADWPAVLAYQQDPAYLRYYAWTERRPAAVRAFVRRFIRHQQAVPRLKFQLAVTLKDDGRLIGNCGIRRASARAHEAEIGYELDPHYWGQGYASEAARAIVAWGFATFQLHRVSAWCIADNLASARVLEKVGMHCEGRLRKKEYFKGRWWDVLLFAVLADELE